MMLSYMRRAVDLVGAPPDHVLIMRCAAVVYGLIEGDTSIAEARTAADDAVAQAGDDVTLRCAALQNQGIVNSLTGHHALGVEQLTEAVAIIESGRVRLGPYLLPGVMLSWSLVELDEFDAAIAASIQAREAAERRGAVALLPMSIAATAAALTYSGRWDDALAEIDAAVDLCNEIGNPTWIIVAAALRGSICLHRGQREAAEAHIADGVKRLLVSGPGLGSDALVEAQIELLVAQGDLDSASRSPACSGTRAPGFATSSGTASGPCSPCASRWRTARSTSPTP